MDDLFHRYEKGVAPARNRLARCQAFEHVLAPDVPEMLLQAFLLDYCARGIGMTEPVEGWIRRAGERCCQLGVRELGERLVAHARSEAGHHLLMVADTQALVARWNAQCGPGGALDAEQLLGRGSSPAVAAYVRVHEDVIAGHAPFAQIAIEFEIEAVSVRHGAEFAQQCVRRLGPSIGECLSFIREHVTADVGHTEFNRRELAKHLERDPSTMRRLVETGSAALDAYGAFLDECLDFAAARSSLGSARR